MVGFYSTCVNEGVNNLHSNKGVAYKCLKVGRKYLVTCTVQTTQLYCTDHSVVLYRPLSCTVTFTDTQHSSRGQKVIDCRGLVVLRYFQSMSMYYYCTALKGEVVLL